MCNHFFRDEPHRQQMSASIQLLQAQKRCVSQGAGLDQPIYEIVFFDPLFVRTPEGSGSTYLSSTIQLFLLGGLFDPPSLT